MRAAQQEKCIECSMDNASMYLFCGVKGGSGRVSEGFPAGFPAGFPKGFWQGFRWVSVGFRGFPKAGTTKAGLESHGFS